MRNQFISGLLVLFFVGGAFGMSQASDKFVQIQTSIEAADEIPAKIFEKAAKEWNTTVVQLKGEYIAGSVTVKKLDRVTYLFSYVNNTPQNGQARMGGSQLIVIDDML